MIKNKKAMFGWILSFALGSGIIAAGFQAKQEKVGVVDFMKVVLESKEVKRYEDSMRQAQAVRAGLINFIQQNPTIKVEDALKLRDLTLKPTQTDADKNEIERIKKEAIASQDRLRKIQTTQKPTQQELTELDDLNRRASLIQQQLERIAGEMQNEMADKQALGNADVRSKIREIISGVAKSQGYTIVYSTDSAVYGVNDITSDCIKAAQK
jgi:Skp family chaperone for outer membrane proteins